MRIVVFTSNAMRHKFIANTLSASVDDALVVSECVAQDTAVTAVAKGGLSPIEEHLLLRQRAEEEFFKGNDFFVAKTLPLMYGEVNLPHVCDIVRRFKPDAMVVFGSSMIKEPLLSLLPPGHFINLHLGLSPYYRGSGTNFWPFVNGELEYVGSTILHIDAGIDTGDIITHVRPALESDDTVHTAGCRVIKKSALCLIRIIEMLRSGKRLNRVKQWKVPKVRYYERKDFDERALVKYKDNLKDGLVDKFLKNPKTDIRLVAPQVL